MDTKTKAPVPKKIKKEPGISCLVCDERFERISYRDAHLQATHRPTISDYGCSTCHEEFMTLQEMTAHNEWHVKSNVPHRCLTCSATFPSTKLVNFQSHLLTCVDPSNVVASEFAGNILCGNCNLEYETQNLYDWHACFIGDNSRCPQCQRVFIKRTVLLKHMFKCTGLPPVNAAVTAAPAKKAKGRKKKIARGFQKTKNKPDIPPQNSFKFEPETIIDQNADGDDGDAYDAVDNSFMDTHFADSDNEFEPSNSIITSSGLDMPNSPEKESDNVNSTINSDESPSPAVHTSNSSAPATAIGVRTNANVELSLLQCHVKLEPLDVASLAPSTISVNSVATVNTAPVIEPPQRPLTVPPLTIRIKKEVIRPGYGDEFDATLAHNIKQERVDETYELAGSSNDASQHDSNAHKKSKHRDKPKKLYKKPALLAIKIKQERMERETNDDGEFGESYPDYSMSSGDYSLPPPDAAAANNSPFDNNPLPIITQIHSVIEAGVPVNTDSLFNLPPSISSQSANNIVPFTPIRIKSEFQRPLSPPANTIDSTSISHEHPHDEQQHNQLDNATEDFNQPENEQQLHSEPHSETEQKSEHEQQFDETVDSTMVLESSNNGIENECIQLNHNENDRNEFENNENDEQTTPMECDTSSSFHDNVQSATNVKADEAVDSTAENDVDELVNTNANQTNAILGNTDPQICSSAADDIQPIPHETHEIDVPPLPIEPMPDTRDQSASNENQVSQQTDDNIIQSIYENTPSSEVDPSIESTSLKGAIDTNNDVEMVEDGQQLSENLTNMEHDGAAATSTEMLQPIDEICDVSNALVTNVTNDNSNISPIDFIENANDESLNFIDQLVHEVADKMVAPQECDDAPHEVGKVMISNDAAPTDSTEMPFMATTEFNYNVECSMKNAAENNESNAQTIDEAAKTTLLALSDIPDIDYNLLPVLNDTNEFASNPENKVNACSSSEAMDDGEDESGAITAAVDGGNDHDNGNDGNNDTGADANATINPDTNSQVDVEEPKLPIN